MAIYNVTEQDYKRVVAEYNELVEEYKAFQPNGNETTKDIIFRALLKKLDYKPLAWLPTVHYDDKVDYVDGSVDMDTLRSTLLEEFLSCYCERYYHHNVVGYDLSLWVRMGLQYVSNPNHVPIGDEYNEFSMKIKELRTYDLSPEIIGEMCVEYDDEIEDVLFDDYLSCLDVEGYFDDELEDEDNVDYDAFSELTEMEKWEWLFSGYYSPEAWMIDEW